MPYTLAIDQGTHATRAIVFDRTGSIVDRAEQPIQLHRLDEDRVEQNADEILQSVHRHAVGRGGLDGDPALDRCGLG